MKLTKINNDIKELTNCELDSINGGAAITGTMVALGVGCLVGGISTGQAIGNIINKHKKRK